MALQGATETFVERFGAGLAHEDAATLAAAATVVTEWGVVGLLQRAPGGLVARHQGPADR